MMRARPGWTVARSSSDISFLPLENIIARIFSSSSLSVMGSLHSESPAGTPPRRRTSSFDPWICAEREVATVLLVRLVVVAVTAEDEVVVDAAAFPGGRERSGRVQHRVAGLRVGRGADAAASDGVEDEEGRP